MPHTGVHQDEGCSDETPIVLHGHSSADFDCLLDHFFGRIQVDVDEPLSLTPTANARDSRESVSFLNSLLNMNAVFEIYIAKSHAIHHLDTHPDLDLITKLELCHHFRIISWLPPTFKALVTRPIESFDPLGLE